MTLCAVHESVGTKRYRRGSTTAGPLPVDLLWCQLGWHSSDHDPIVSNISGVDRSSSVPVVHIDEKDRDRDDFLFRLGDDLLLRPRRAAAVGLTGTLLIIERSVREAPLK